MATLQATGGVRTRSAHGPGVGVVSLVIVVGILTTVPVQAQDSAPTVHQVISANPFGLLLNLFNAEFERQVTATATAGAGGSTWHGNGESYGNVDVFYRYYPSGRPMDGWAFGVKAGITVSDGRSFPGIGFDTNWSELLGKADRFYVGIGFGLKRLFGTRDPDVHYLPTIRIVNVGVAF